MGFATMGCLLCTSKQQPALVAPINYIQFSDYLVVISKAENPVDLADPDPSDGGWLQNSMNTVLPWSANLKKYAMVNTFYIECVICFIGVNR